MPTPQTKRKSRSLLTPLLLVIALCAGCGPRTPPIVPPVGGFPPDFPAAFYGAQAPEAVYRIVPARSSVLLKVYRAGALASIGHSHVIESRSVDGFIYLADDLTAARADLFMPVASLVVDDAAARAAAGADFATQPTADDIEGTRANMLGPKLLDAAQFPFVVVHVAPLQVGPQSTQVQLELSVRGHTAEVPVDVVWRRSGAELTTQANFQVDHATLLLEPFSAAGGLLRVAPQIDVTVTLVALVTKEAR